MDKKIIRGKWKEIKGQVQQRWEKFTDDDITTMEGSYDELFLNLQKKYGYKKEKVEEEINTFLEEHGWFDDHRNNKNSI